MFHIKSSLTVGSTPWVQWIDLTLTLGYTRKKTEEMTFKPATYPYQLLPSPQASIKILLPPIFIASRDLSRLSPSNLLAPFYVSSITSSSFLQFRSVFAFFPTFSGEASILPLVSKSQLVWVQIRAPLFQGFPHPFLAQTRWQSRSLSHHRGEDRELSMSALPRAHSTM